MKKILFLIFLGAALFVVGRPGFASVTALGNGGGLTGVGAGSNIVLTGPSTAPTIGVTNAPSFTGTVQSMGTYLPPEYTLTGAAVASTVHSVLGPGQNVSPGTCVLNTVCPTTTSITLSNAAVYTNQNSFTCVAYVANSALIVYATNTSASAFTISYYATAAGTYTTIGMEYECMGF